MSSKNQNYIRVRYYNNHMLQVRPVPLKMDKRKYSKDQLTFASKEVRSGSLRQHGAAKKYNIPKATLHIVVEHLVSKDVHFEKEKRRLEKLLQECFSDEEDVNDFEPNGTSDEFKPESKNEFNSDSSEYYPCKKKKVLTKILKV
ncbi:unnamed protein product [Diabrotica balteata]|uniref:HTH psq-type domain-containing protein n=1 Tax=Diabrotica balteata TaxID=107213 RepID=A0A9N9X9F5_DIABA|nr:unnamed protein product [Diabrotica balteata]